MLAVLYRGTAVLSFTSALLFVCVLTGMLVSSFSISNNQPLPASPILLTASRAYSRNELLTLCCHEVTPARSVRKAIFSYRLWLPRYSRFHRAVWNFQLSSSVTPSVDNGETSLPSAKSASDRICTSTLTYGCQRFLSSKVSRNAPLTFGLLNIRSIVNKLDDLLEVRRDRSIEVLCLVETWHDADSATFRRLLKDSYQVVDRPRPRTSSVGDLATNHGGVALVAAPGVGLAPVAVVDYIPMSFKMTCARLKSGCFPGIVVIYRPGSAAVQSTFFEELAAVFDGIATHQEPVFVVRDLNIRLDRSDDPHARQLNDLVADYGFAVRPTTSTHKLGGTTDAVITRIDSSGPTVSCFDVGLSDHFMLQWSVIAERPSSPTTIEYVTQRPWRQLDIDGFRAALIDSVLCQPNVWPDDVDQLAILYHSTLTELLDRLKPFRQFTRRPRASDPWFDYECRVAKRTTRRLERAYSAAARHSAAHDTDVNVRAAEAAWRAQRVKYRNLRQYKRRTFWLTTVEADKGSPQKLRRSVDALLGRGRSPISSVIDVETFNKFFSDKVAAVRSATDGANQPSYTNIGAHSSWSSFTELTTADVVAAIHQLPDKSSAADPIPVSVLKQIAVKVLLPIQFLFLC
jgi:hypothetical protein